MPEKNKRFNLRPVMPIFRFLRPHRGIFSIGFIFLLLSSATALIFPSLMGDLLDAQQLTDAGQKDWWKRKDINSISLLLILVFLAQAVFSYFRIYLFSLVTERFLMDLRQAVYNHLICLPLSFFEKERVGGLNSRLAADIALLQETFTTSLAEFVRQFITIIAGVVLISIFSWQLTLLMLTTIPVIAIAAVLFGRFIKKFAKKAQEEVAHSSIIVEETFTTIAVVKAFANEMLEMLRYKKATERVRDVSMTGARWRAAFVSFIIFTVFSAIVLVIWKAANLKESGLLTIGELIKFILYTVFIGASFAGIPELYAKIQKAIGASQHLVDLLGEKKEVTTTRQDKTHVKIHGDVRFEGVNFSYPSRPDTVVLKDLSFDVKSGERIALVGPSGAGKSTLISLLMRFYEIKDGCIYLDEKNIQSFDLNDLRNQVSLVPQEIILFGGTIRENIAYGKPGCSQEEIEIAARKANAEMFIQSFPNGYDELVGDRGIQLSGGQRQRIAIARVFLRNPSILILDEATSSLDSATETLIKESLDELMKGRTSFIIAHRLSTIQDADRILVMENGQLLESGNHQELLNNSTGLYNHLQQLQQNTEKP